MKKDHQYRIRLTAEDFILWNGAARALRIPLSDLIREAMRVYLNAFLNVATKGENNE